LKGIQESEISISSIYRAQLRIRMQMQMQQMQMTMMMLRPPPVTPGGAPPPFPAHMPGNGPDVFVQPAGATDGRNKENA
jgi:hypothetical protein